MHEESGLGLIFIFFAAVKLLLSFDAFVTATVSPRATRRCIEICIITEINTSSAMNNYEMIQSSSMEAYIEHSFVTTLKGLYNNSYQIVLTSNNRFDDNVIN